MNNEKEKRKRTKEELDSLISAMRGKGYPNWEIARALDISEARVVETLEVKRKKRR